MSIIDEIKQKLDIVEYIGEFVSLKPSGRNFKAPCPFHSEKTPSFFVFPEQQSWHCFGACGTGGDIFTFLMKKDGLDFSQALHIFADRTGIALVNPSIQDQEQDQKKEILCHINEEAAVYYHHVLLNSNSGEFARTYLVKRGLSKETIEHFQLGFSMDSYDNLYNFLLNRNFSINDMVASGLLGEKDKGGYYDRFRNRIMFPIRNIQSQVVGFGARAIDDSIPKYLNTPQTKIFDKSATLYGIDKAKTTIRQKNMAIVTEGYMDVITSHQHGWINTVASMGTALTKEHINVLNKLTHNIVVALDSDVAGTKGTIRTAEMEDLFHYVDILKGQFNEIHVVIPSKAKDLDEEIRKNPQFWDEDLKNSKPLFDFIIETIRNATDLRNANEKMLASKKFVDLIVKLDQPITRGHYIQSFAQAMKINENDLRDQVTQIRGLHKKRRSSPAELDRKEYLHKNLEEYCLGLILQHPNIRTTDVDIPLEYFEYNENRDIFTKWKQNGDIEYIKGIIDPILQPHWNSLLLQEYPSDLTGNEDKQRRVLADCITRMQEKYLKNLEVKKRLLLIAEAEHGGKHADLSKLEEQGCEPSQQLRKIFVGRGQRQKPAELKD